MANLYTHRDSNIRKTWLLITVFLLLVIGIGWVLSFAFQTTAILVIAIVLSTVMSFSSYWWSGKLVLAMSHAKPIAKKDAPELYRIVENLSITAGLPMPRLYVLNEEAPNAFATGRNPDHAVVAVTTGLLRRLNRSELEGVLAHELSHIGNRDILISTVVVVLAGIIILATDILGRSLLWGSIGGRNRRGGGGALLLGFVALLIGSVIATLLKFAISRKREFLADASGALLTRYPEGLASALEKIAADPARLSVASNATAHLYFENPFKSDKKKGKGTGWFARLFLTHPPVEERVAALRGEHQKK